MSLDSPGRVYVIQNAAWPAWVKVGICFGGIGSSADSLRRRLIQFNVGDPRKTYRVVADYYAACAVSAERFAHTLLEVKHLRGGGEWFRCSPEIARQIVERVCSIARGRPETRDSKFKVVLEEMKSVTDENVVPEPVKTGPEEIRTLAKEAHDVIFALVERMAMSDKRLEDDADDVMRRLVRLGTSV